MRDPATRPEAAATAAPPPPLASDGLPPARRIPAMLTVILGIGLCVLDSTMVTLALPGMVRELGIPEGDAVWLVNAYQLAVLVLLLPLAMAGDLFGYRRVYLCGVALFALITLPVEFDASRRARLELAGQGLVGGDEMVGVNRVLDAAALTYVAGLAQALSTLLYYVFILTGGRRRN